MSNYKITGLAFVCIFILSALAAGCASHESASTKSITPAGTSEVKAAAFRAELATQPAQIAAGAPVALNFTVKNAQGALTRDLQVVHEKPMHLLIVSSDLAEFYHVHPAPQADGAYQVTHTFPHGGAYRLYADFTPPNAAQTVEQIALKVSGNERAQQPLTADTVMTKSVDGISVTLAPDKALKPGSELMLNFKVADAKTGQPVTNLQKYLGEYAHFVIISADLKEFLHAHPMSRATHNAGGEHPHAPGTKPHAHQAEAASPAEVAAHTTFPQAGTYKVWAQFQRAEQVITMPFVINVPASGDTAVVAKDEGQPHSAAHKH